METPDITIKKMLLSATLKANLDALNHFLPPIYDMFKDFVPQESGVVLDHSGNIDLYNQQQHVYKGMPESFAKQQVEEFIQTPLFFNLELEKETGSKILYDHQRVLKKITEKRESEVKSSPKFNEERLDFVCMLGVGLGYQLPELLAQKKVQHLYLCEPSKDIFYAMLHCIELRPIIEHCMANGGGITINTGNDYNYMLNGINDVLKRIGRFYLPRFYVFKHYDSETTDNFVNTLKEIGYRFAFGWGFMEDEIIGFRHTLANLKLGYKVCKKPSEFINSAPERPVFIVANGPSVDFSLDFLKENQKDIIIVSCGTTLRVLLKHNIKPDIHVEMERPVEMLPFIEEIEKQQLNSEIKLKDIQIIALNTVYPELLKKFKTPRLLNKLNDTGGQFIEALDTKDVYVRPAHTNPTCPNTATALMISLGFKEIYFIGTDFGYVSNEYHHSKDSIYYEKTYDKKVQGNNKEPHGEDKDREGVIDNLMNRIDDLMSKDFQCEGNFRESVYSNRMFDSSRKQIEDLLAEYDDVNAYNCADGALIKCAEPMKIIDIQLKEYEQPKSLFLDKLLSDAFDNKAFTAKKLTDNINKTFHVLKVTLDQLVLMMDKEVTSREDLVGFFSEQHKLLIQLVTRNEYKFNYWMIQGTFQYLQTYIMSNAFMYENLTERNEFMNFCIGAFKAHIDFLYKELTEQIV